MLPVCAECGLESHVACRPTRYTFIGRKGQLRHLAHNDLDLQSALPCCHPEEIKRGVLLQDQPAGDIPWSPHPRRRGRPGAHCHALTVLPEAASVRNWGDLREEDRRRNGRQPILVMTKSKAEIQAVSVPASIVAMSEALTPNTASEVSQRSPSTNVWVTMVS